MIDAKRFERFKHESVATPVDVAEAIDYPKYQNRIIEVPKHTKFWWEKIEKSESIFIESARGHFKSRSIAVIYPLYKLIKNPNLRIVLASETVTQMEKWVKEIKNNIEDPHKPYNYLKPERPETWTKRELTIKRSLQSGDSSITATGVGKAVLSSRADILILDDVISKKNSRTRIQREKVKDWYRETILPILTPDGKVIVIGTPKHEDDLYADFRDDPDMDYFFFPAEKPKEEELEDYHKNFYDNEDEVLWPRVWDKERLESRRNKITASAYASEYLLNLSKQEGGVVEPEWIDYYGKLDDDRRYTWAMGVDPSTGDNEEGDYTGLVVVARDDKSGTIYVEDADQGIWKSSTRLEKIQSYCDDYPITKVGIEDVSTTKDFINFLERETMLPINRLSTMGKDKKTRLETITPRIENSKVKFRRALDKSEIPLIDQLIEFPEGSYDDLVDAFVYACWNFKESYNERAFELFER